MTAQWGLGIIIGLPIAALLVLVGIAFAILSVRSRGSETAYTEGEWKIGVGIGAGWAVIVLLFCAVTYFPYEAQYHLWQPVTGTVEKVDKRLIASGKSMEERVLLTINGQPYGVDDTRAAGVKPGDTVTIMCKRQWQYASVPGYVCRWGQ